VHGSCGCINSLHLDDLGYVEVVCMLANQRYQSSAAVRRSITQSRIGTPIHDHCTMRSAFSKQRHTEAHTPTERQYICENTVYLTMIYQAVHHRSGLVDYTISNPTEDGIGYFSGRGFPAHRTRHHWKLQEP
jgi:hypothetical protein